MQNVKHIKTGAIPPCTPWRGVYKFEMETNLVFYGLFKRRLHEEVRKEFEKKARTAIKNVLK